MAEERTMAHEYGKEAIKALILVNGGAAVALLSQAAKLIEMKLGDDVAYALGVWAFGLIVAVLCWLAGFLSLRFADRAKDYTAEAEKFAAEITVSNRFLYTGQFLFLVSLVAFGVGCAVLANSILALEHA